MSEQNKPTPEKQAGDDKKQGGNHYRRHGKRPYHHGKRHNKPRNAEDQPQNEEAMPAEEELMSQEEETAAVPAEEIPEIIPEAAPEGEKTEDAPAEEESAPVETTEVIGVRFRASGKIYYFDPKGLPYPLGCHAIVDTARGMEYGEVAMTNRPVPTSELVLPLREALRIATSEDDRHHIENKAKEAEAAEVWVKKVAFHGLEMKLIDVECTFDNSKLLFYFTAEGRVDFRDLVKDLASVFRCRIELRQMGIRDEAKILGGLGVCGRPFCCHSFLPDFVQVSIKMAKEQNLSLNSAKISGACGRLMCCLRYEYDTYLEEAKLTPKVDSLVRTPDGVGTVIETKPLLGLVKVQPVNAAPDAPAVVYSRDLLTPIKPGEPIEIPAPKPAAQPQIKEKIEKLPEAKKPEPAPKAAPKGQNQKKRPEGMTEKKKAEPEQHKKAEKPEKTDAPAVPKEGGAKEHKYVIQRGNDTPKNGESPAKNADAAPKKRYGYHHHRQNRGAKDQREKKGGES